MIEQDNYAKAVIVSGDGDFYCLVDYLISKGKLAKLLIPNKNLYSALLKRVDSKYLIFVSDMRKKLAYTYRRKQQQDKAQNQQPQE